jgi:hypothetical protein
MPLSAAGIVYAVGGGLILYSGIKGATIADTFKAVLSGNLTVQDTEPITFGSTSGPSAAGSGISGAAILADAEKYAGHKYVYGGPSNPTSGWDCSSFASYVLGHDMNMAIPTGQWVQVTNNGAEHGPTAADYLSWSGASDIPASEVQPGDLLCWPTHVGFAVDSSHMFSAYDTQSGTLQTTWAGPSGEGDATVRRINVVTESTTPSGGNAGFAEAVLQGLGAPATAANLKSMNNWFAHEGTSAQNNPMATTESEPGATTFNSAGVKNYPNEAVGVAATVATLENGLYPAIVFALRGGVGLSTGNSQVESELSTWSGGGYSSV